MSPRRIWSDAQTALFIGLVREGLPRDVIAERMGDTITRINGQYYHLRKMGRIDCPMALRQSDKKRANPLAGREDEIRAMSVHGMSTCQIARHFEVTLSRAQHFMTKYGLYAAARKHAHGHRCQSYAPGINLARVRLPDVCEADVKLARQAWREFEGAS